MTLTGTKTPRHFQLNTNCRLLRESWERSYTTAVLFEHGGYDYYDFYNSFTGEGFSLLINLAEGGTMPG